MRTSKPLLLSDTQREILHAIVNRRTARADMVERGTILLTYERTKNKTDTAQSCTSTWDKVNRWVNRWNTLEDERMDLEHAYQHTEIDRPYYENQLEAFLSDAPRPGAPTTFTEEQKRQIIALATQKPEDVGVPITHWSHTELVRAAIKTGVVDTISSTHIGRFLKDGNATTTQE